MKQCMDAANLHRRLRKIIGQVNAIDKMVDEDIPCEDILSQINAAKSALNKCGQIVLEGHINHCVREAFEKGDEGHRTLRQYAVKKKNLILPAGRYPVSPAHRRFGDMLCD